MVYKNERVYIAVQPLAIAGKGGRGEEGIMEVSAFFVRCKDPRLLYSGTTCL